MNASSQVSFKFSRIKPEFFGLSQSLSGLTNRRTMRKQVLTLGHRNLKAGSEAFGPMLGSDCIMWILTHKINE